MSFIIFLSAVLAVDSFITCLTFGMCQSNVKPRKIWLLISTISLFHFLMPILGFALSTLFPQISIPISKYIAASIFLILGIKMLHEGVLAVRTRPCSDPEISSLTMSKIVGISLLLSIDAGAAGVSIFMIGTYADLIFTPVLFALFSFVFSIIGYHLGKLLHRFVRVYSIFFAGLLMMLLAFKTALT